MNKTTQRVVAAVVAATSNVLALNIIPAPINVYVAIGITMVATIFEVPNQQQGNTLANPPTTIVDPGSPAPKA